MNKERLLEELRARLEKARKAHKNKCANGFGPDECSDVLRAEGAIGGMERVIAFVESRDA
jgi:hypothetical protein